MAQPHHERSGSSSSDALRNWEKNQQYAATLPFPPTATNTLVSENIQLRDQLDIRASIAGLYETERDACHKMIEILSAEMKRAVKSAERWKGEVGERDVKMEAILKEQERLQMLCKDLEEALDRTNEELEMRLNASANMKNTSLLLPPSTLDNDEEDQFVSFDDDRRPGQHHYFDRTMRTEATNLSRSQAISERSVVSQSSTQRPFAKPALGPESSFDLALHANEASIQRQEDHYEALQVQVITLQQEKDDLLKEREQLLNDKNQMEVDSQKEQEYQEQLFTHSAQLETRLDETSTQLHQALENLDIARARLRTLERENTELEDAKAKVEQSAHTRRASWDGELARIHKEMEEERAWAARALAATDARVAALDAEKVEERVAYEAKRRELQAALEFERERREEREGEMDALRDELEKLRNRKYSAETEEMAALRAQLTEVRQKRRTEDDDLLNALRKEVAVMKARTNGLEQANATLELQVSGLKKKVEANKQDKEGLNIALDAKQQELDLLKRKMGAARSSSSSRALASARSRASSVTASIDDASQATTTASVLLPKTSMSREKGTRRPLQRSSSVASIVSTSDFMTGGDEDATPLPVRRLHHPNDRLPLMETNSMNTDDRRLAGIKGVGSIQEGERPARALMEDTFVPPPSRAISFPEAPSSHILSASIAEDDTSATPRRLPAHGAGVGAASALSQSLLRGNSARSTDRRAGKRYSEENEKENMPRMAVAA
ncbi:hypothetical protein FRB94_002341 [Tulasnella sp. JGI-2019a]|nr:hypothetical protein FRB94_002341 [Tulasnella sp. JGI-2019a]